MVVPSIVSLSPIHGRRRRPNEFQQVLQTLFIDELSHIANDRRASVRTLPEPFQFRTHVPKLC
jgi:hypothetical protein